MGMIETAVYSINYRTILTYHYNFVDPGGTISIHKFGAYFDVAVAWCLGKPLHEPKGMYLRDEMAFIGTLFFWVFWPSFVGGSLEPNSLYQQRAIINTILSLSASTVTTFALSKFLSRHSKFCAMDIQNATLAGRVAIGAVASLTLSPFNAMVIGTVAGAVSTVGYNKIQSFLLSAIHLHDTYGIHNLHGMPSMVGGLTSIIIAAYKNSGGRHSDSEIYGVNFPDNAANYQAPSVITTLTIALTSRTLTGMILKFFRADAHKFNDETKFHDSVWWEGAEDEKA